MRPLDRLAHVPAEKGGTLDARTTPPPRPTALDLVCLRGTLDARYRQWVLQDVEDSVALKALIGGDLLAKQISYLTELRQMQTRALPRPLFEEWRWQLQDRCLGYPSDVFFPAGHGRQGRRRREEYAKKICRDCPILARCRAHALKTPELYGVWRAMTARERARALSPDS